MTHSRVCFHLFIHVTWLIYAKVCCHVCAMTYSCVWPWLLHVCAMTHSCVCHDSFTPESFMCDTWLIHMCDMTHSCVWHDSFICVTWLIHTEICRHAHRCVRKHTLSHKHIPSLSLSLFSLSHTHTYSLSLSHTHTRIHVYTHAHTHTCTTAHIGVSAFG